MTVAVRPERLEEFLALRGLLRRIWDWLCAPHRRARAAMPST